MKRGRGKRRRGGDDFVAPEIPWEIQMEILIRLPSKSLMRFKCVSKLWLSLIRSRYFTNRFYLTAASPPRRRLFMSLVDRDRDRNRRVSALLSLSSSSSSSSNKAKSFYPDLTMPRMGGYMLAALRGLFLYMVCRNACICNPTTRQRILLPALKSNIFSRNKALSNKQIHYFFGHDPVLDQYKVVCNAVLFSEEYDKIISEHWVLVLEADGGSWRRIEFDGQPHVPTRRGVCIDGVIYYLASTCMSRSIVISFGVRSEEFNTFQVPLPVSALYTETGFIEYGGKPALFDHTNFVPMGLVDLWVLEDGGRWSTKSLALQPCQMHLVEHNNMSH